MTAVDQLARRTTRVLDLTERMCRLTWPATPSVAWKNAQALLDAAAGAARRRADVDGRAPAQDTWGALGASRPGARVTGFDAGAWTHAAPGARSQGLSTRAAHLRAASGENASVPGAPTAVQMTAPSATATGEGRDAAALVEEASAAATRPRQRAAASDVAAPAATEGVELSGGAAGGSRLALDSDGGAAAAAAPQAGAGGRRTAVRAAPGAHGADVGARSATHATREHTGSLVSDTRALGTPPTDWPHRAAALDMEQRTSEPAAGFPAAAPARSPRLSAGTGKDFEPSSRAVAPEAAPPADADVWAGESQAAAARDAGLPDAASDPGAPEADAGAATTHVDLHGLDLDAALLAAASSDARAAADSREPGRPVRIGRPAHTIGGDRLTGLNRLALGTEDLAGLGEHADVAPEPRGTPTVDLDALIERLIEDLELEYLRLYGTDELGR